MKPDLEQDIRDGDFGLVAWYGKRFYPVIVNNADKDFIRFTWCNQHCADCADKKDRRPSQSYCRKYSFIKLDVSEANKDIQAYYKKIVKHTKGI